MVDCNYPTAAIRGETVSQKNAGLSPLISGLILSGGVGQRVGGCDKGLLGWRGERLIDHVYRRIKVQVGPVIISCNRNIDVYRQFLATVVVDSRENFQGPLAGLEAALAHVDTEYLAVVPCDTPLIPMDMVERLLRPMLKDDRLAISYTRTEERDHYLCALLRCKLLSSLSDYLESGERAVKHWYGLHRTAPVAFASAGDAFMNVNEMPG